MVKLHFPIAWLIISDYTNTIINYKPMKILQNRVSYHGEIAYPLLQEGYLTIGFSDFAEQQFIDELLAGNDWQERWQVLERYFEEKWGGQNSRRHDLWRFLEGVSKGDRILVPQGNQFSVFELTAEQPQPIGQLPINELRERTQLPLIIENGRLFLEDNPDCIDLGFFWEVAPIETYIPRDYAEAKLTARMKYRRTNVWMNDLVNDLDKALQAYKAEKPIDLYEQIIEDAVPMVLEKIRNKLNPKKLEALVKWYFKKMGASNVDSPPNNEANKEGDADVIATFEPLKLIIYTQVKFHEGETNSWALEQIQSYVGQKSIIGDDDYNHVGWVISTADRYSEECIEKAKEAGVRLINGSDFSLMLLETGISGLDRL